MQGCLPRTLSRLPVQVWDPTQIQACACPIYINFIPPFYRLLEESFWVFVGASFDGQITGSLIQQNSSDLPQLGKMTLFCGVSKEEKQTLEDIK